MSKTDTEPDLISANGIARQLGRSAQGVVDALQRLGIEPQLKLPSGNYYTPDVVEQVRTAMRQPNRKTTPVAEA